VSANHPGTDRSPSLVDKVCMVTGATGGMGRAISTDLARRGATVVLIARTPASGQDARAFIVAATGNPRVQVLTADLSDQASIRHLAEQFQEHHEQLHVLVNNAGAHFRDRARSVDGIEMHLAVNHLSWFLLTRLLLDPLEASAPARIVNIGSQSMADTRQLKIRRTPRPATLDLADLNSEHNFQPMAVYATAKLEMLMCSYALARRLIGTGVTVNTAHPGITATNIVDAISAPALKPFLGVVKRFLLTPEQGAQAAIHLATAPELETTTGRYFIKQTQARSPEVSYNTALQEQLWAASSDLVGLPRWADPAEDAR